MTVIDWVIRALIAICVFVIARWLIPVLFALVGVSIPDQVATVIALLIALLIFWYWIGRPIWPNRVA